MHSNSNKVSGVIKYITRFPTDVIKYTTRFPARASTNKVYVSSHVITSQIID